MMKRVLTATLFVSTLAFAAETTANIPLTAQAQPGCAIKNTPSLNIQYTGVSDATGNFQIQIECDNQTQYTVTVGQGQNADGGVRRAKDNQNNFIKYRLYSDAAMTQELGVQQNNSIQGTGNGQTQNITIFARVLYQENQNVPTGTYTDTIRITVSW